MRNDSCHLERARILLELVIGAPQLRPKIAGVDRLSLFIDTSFARNQQSRNISKSMRKPREKELRLE